MAEWIKQVFHADGYEVALERHQVTIKGPGGAPNYTYLPTYIVPTTREAAHELAMLLRKAARRMEEIGKGLPNDPR